MSKSTTWQQIERTCALCNKPFFPTRNWQKTCSKKCGYTLQNNKRVIPINSRKCARCGASLAHKNNRAMYCSKTCKSMDHNFKHRGGSRLTTARRRVIIERDLATCYLCKTVLAYKDIELDHLVPQSRGGDSGPSNLSVTCLKCNRSRGNRIEVEQLHRLRELRESNDY